MAKRVNQIRFYGTGNKNNSKEFYGTNAVQNKQLLTSGTIFETTMPIVQLGIQTIPGAKFKINNGNYITIGSTGIYELNVDGITRIDRLQFDLEVVDFIDKHKNPNDNNTYSNAYLIVDYIYDQEEA